ncbi:hypothetical protein [Rhodoblastus sp.]|uniref:hypothetical protein n=1 Tax=Rhodoblastus sp. TaxID=1962975 RepID=UPI00262480F8|nr:hypothetical protein [Rhodoblastus sp.]
MPTFKLPLSGDVVQSINPMTWWNSPVGSQFGLVNINLGRSGNPKVEEDLLSDFGSYGRQIGRLADALAVLARHFEKEMLRTEEGRKAYDGLMELTEAVAEAKKRRERGPTA